MQKKTITMVLPSMYAVIYSRAVEKHVLSWLWFMFDANPISFHNFAPKYFAFPAQSAKKPSVSDVYKYFVSPVMRYMSVSKEASLSAPDI